MHMHILIQTHTYVRYMHCKRNYLVTCSSLDCELNFIFCLVSFASVCKRSKETFDIKITFHEVFVCLFVCFFFLGRKNYFTSGKRLMNVTGKKKKKKRKIEEEGKERKGALWMARELNLFISN